VVFQGLFCFIVQVSPQELEADKPAHPPDPPAVEPENENQDTEHPETEVPQNPSREFLKFANQALELKVRSNIGLLCHLR